MTGTERTDRAPRGPDERTPPKSARRRSRELAMQGLYQWLLSREDAGAIEAHLVATSPNFDKADREHFEQLLHGSIREIDALHAQIEPHLDRRVAELSPVEAVELAKTFGGTDGYKYINGVLDKVAARARPAEIRPR